MSDILELTVNATATGCIYALVALAYLLILRPTGIINFAIGEWAMAGAFISVAALTAIVLPAISLPYPLAAIVILVIMAAIGWATERVAVRPLLRRKAAILSPILALLGVLVIMRELGALVFGVDPLPSPPPFGFRRMTLGPFAGTPQNFYIIASTLLVFLGAWLFFERTIWGRAFEAVAIDRRAAALMGVNLNRVTALAFAAGAALAGFAGLLTSAQTSAHYMMGLPLAIQGFTALVIGGVGRVEGALLGGLVIAFAEQFATRYTPIPSGLTLGVPLLLLILFLFVRPSGLLPAKEGR